MPTLQPAPKSSSSSRAAMVDRLPVLSSSRILHEKGEKYLLPVDEEEHERYIDKSETSCHNRTYSAWHRLRVQHEMLKEAGNGKVFFPPFDSSKSYFILDVGVGPGMSSKCRGYKILLM